MSDKTVFTEKEAAAYLNLHPTTLARGRMDKKRDKRCPVPPYVRIGRTIRYLKADLDRFLEANRVQQVG